MLTFYTKKPNENSFTPLQKPETRCWIHIDTATTEDIEAVCKLTELHITDLLDALDRYELPRVEVIRDTVLLFARYPVEQESYLHTMPLTIALTKDYLITISSGICLPIRDILEHRIEDAFEQPVNGFFKILLRISQEFALQIRNKRNAVMAREKAIDTIEGEDISLLTKQEETLNQYLSCLELLHGALTKSTLRDFPGFSSDCRRELDDLINSVKQSENLCSSLIKGIRSLRDSYQIIFANKLTKTIKLLTALTIIFSIPNIVASIYGMNVRLPLAGRADAFPLLMFLMFLISGLCGYWFYKKKWM